MELAIMGVIAGTILFLSKAGLFYLFTGGRTPYMIWYPFKKSEPETIRHWVHRSPVRQGLLDILFGIMGAKAVSMLGQSMAAGLAMITYSSVCMLFLMKGILFDAFKNWCQGIKCSFTGILFGKKPKRRYGHAKIHA